MTAPQLRGRLIAWRRAELAVTQMVEEVRRRSLYDDPLCDDVLDRLDRIDTRLDAIRRLAEDIESDLRVDERGAA